MEKILIVEDDKNMAKILMKELEHEGYGTVLAEDGRTAISLFESEKPDLILLDIMIPEMNGIEVLRKIRMTSDVPVILETARDETFDKVNGLRTGADDYIAKPFDIEELLARISAVLRRCEKRSVSAGPANLIKIGNLELNTDNLKASANGKDLNLTKTEFMLLKLFIENKGKVLSRDQIIDSVWGEEHYTESGSVDVYVRFLRSKITEFDDFEYIKTVRGAGYIFSEA